MGTYLLRTGAVGFCVSGRVSASEYSHNAITTDDYWYELLTAKDVPSLRQNIELISYFWRPVIRAGALIPSQPTNYRECLATDPYFAYHCDIPNVFDTNAVSEIGSFFLRPSSQTDNPFRFVMVVRALVFGEPVVLAFRIIAGPTGSVKMESSEEEYRSLSDMIGSKPQTFTKPRRPEEVIAQMLHSSHRTASVAEYAVTPIVPTAVASSTMPGRLFNVTRDTSEFKCLNSGLWSKVSSHDETNLLGALPYFIRDYAPESSIETGYKFVAKGFVREALLRVGSSSSEWELLANYSSLSCAETIRAAITIRLNELAENSTHSDKVYAAIFSCLS